MKTWVVASVCTQLEQHPMTTKSTPKGRSPWGIQTSKNCTLCKNLGGKEVRGRKFANIGGIQ